MSIQDRVKEEIKEKKRQIRVQYAGDIRTWLQKQKDEYINFFKNCPQTGRYAGAIVVGVLIGIAL